MLKKIFKTIKNLLTIILKQILKIHIQKAVEQAEKFLKDSKGQEKKNYVIDLVFSKIKFPSWLNKLELKLKDFISTFIDELIEKAVKELKEKLKNG